MRCCSFVAPIATLLVTAACGGGTESQDPAEGAGRRGGPNSAADAGSPSVSPDSGEVDPSSTDPLASAPVPDGTGPDEDPEVTPSNSGPMPVGTVPGEPSPDGEVVPGAPDCSAARGPASLRRLAAFEYDNTVRVLFGDDTARIHVPVYDTSRFGNSALGQVPSLTLVTQYAEHARDVATRAVNDAEARATYLPCLNSVTPETEATCAGDIIDGIGAAAFRHPLDAEARAELVALYEELRTSGTFEDSITSLLEAILQGPDFLYRLEFGEPDAAGQLRPSGYEMATRLSYTLWGSPPDDALYAAAAAGQLSEPSGVNEHAQRMLENAAARPHLNYFFSHFLRMNTPATQGLNPELFPTFTAERPEQLRQETLGFVDHEIFEGSGTWLGVLTTPTVFVNEELAGYYGIEGVGGPAFRAVEVDPAVVHRQGLLTQGSFLSRDSANRSHPFRRGLRIFADLMCQELSPPPATVEILPPVQEEFTTTRALWEQTTSPVACALCHEEVDRIGFGLENYDAAGLWRETENGFPIDAASSTMLLGAFNGPEELIASVAANEATYACLANQWGRFSYARPLDPNDDACVLQQLNDAFTDSGYDVKALVLASTQTEAFHLLPASESAP